MHHPELISVVTRLTAALDERGIDWCVLRNYETFPRPRSDTSDLDFMLGCKPSMALEVLEELMNAQVGMGTVISRSGGLVVSVFLTMPRSPALRLDFMRTAAWAGCDLIAADVLMANRQFVNDVPIPAAGHEAADSLMTYLFHRGRVKEEYKQHIQETVRRNPAEFAACLAPVWGGPAADELSARAIAGDWDWFAGWVQGAKRSLLLRACINPFSAVKTLFEFTANTVRRILQSPGLWIAFLGPDGSGKTTVGDAYRARMATLYYPENQRHLHWRPSWLPAPGKIAGPRREPINVTDPHGKPPYGWLVSLLRFYYFWLDFVIGHWFKVRPLLAKGGLVTFDRYYQDFLIDPRRYRLKLPAWVLRMNAHLVPQPELVFVLDAPAEVLHARKQELAQTEITSQLKALRQLAADNQSARIVSVDRAVEEIVDELERETLEYLNRRNRRRLGWKQSGKPLHART